MKNDSSRVMHLSGNISWKCTCCNTG